MVTTKKTTTPETNTTSEAPVKKPRAPRRKKTEAKPSDTQEIEATASDTKKTTEKKTKTVRKPRAPRRKKEETPASEQVQQTVAEQTTEQVTEQTTEQVTEQTVEQKTEQAVEQKTEQTIVEQTIEQKDEQAVEQPTAVAEQQETEQVKEVAAEVKPEVKAEVKPEKKPEKKTEQKPEKKTEQKPLPPCPTLLIRNIIELINAPQRQLLLNDQQIQQLTVEEAEKRFRWIEGTLALVLNYDIVLSDTNIWLELLTGHTSSHSDPRYNCRLQFERQLEFISRLTQYRRGRFMMMSETYEEIDRFATAMDPQSHKDADFTDEAVCRNISGRLAKRLILSQQRENRLRIEGIGAESHHSAFADPAIIRRCVEFFAIGKKVLLLTNDASVAIRAMGMCDDLQRTNGIDDETWDDVYAPLRPMVMTFDDLKVLDAYTRQYHFLQMAAGKQWMEDVPQRMEKHDVEALTLWDEGFRPGDRYSEKKMQQMNAQGNSGKQKQNNNQKQQKQQQQKQEQPKQEPKQQQPKQEPKQEQVKQQPQQKQEQPKQEPKRQQPKQEQPKQQPQPKQEQQQEVVQQEVVQQEAENQSFKPSLISPEEASINENEKKQEQRRRNSRRGGSRRTKSQNNAKAEGTAQSSAAPTPAPAPAAAPAPSAE